MIGVTKPDGSVTTTVYDNKQRVTSTVERTSGGVVITGFEYTYDTNGMSATKKVGAKNAIVYSYENGLLKSQTDSLNHTTRYTHMDFSLSFMIL